MAAIISIAVGFAGAALGTAIGTAIGGTILGISAATIGAVIGAGVAGGLLSMAKGGDFGKGFLIGAVGAGIGSYASSVFGGASGAAEGVVAGTEGAAGTAVSGAVEGTAAAAAPIAGDAATSAIGEMGTSAIADTAGVGIDAAAGGMSAVPAAEGAFSLEGLGATGGMSSAPAASGSFNLGDMGASSMLGGATPVPGLESIGSTQGGFTDAGMNTGFNGASLSNPQASLDTFGTGPNTGGALEGAAPYDPVAASPNSGSGFSLESLGLDGKGAAKLAMGGIDSYMKNREANKLNSLVEQQRPMTFEQFSSQYSDPQAYMYAAENMARAGRTGALPVLLARMKNNVRGKYASYLPGAQQQYLNNKAGIASAKSGALSNLFSGYASNLASKGVA